MNTSLNGEKIEPAVLHFEACHAFFKTCPFCGNNVNVFQVPETRYGEHAPFGWTLECMNMGCIFSRPSADQSLEHLATVWNKRV
jgi:ribosomal protein S27E